MLVSTQKAFQMAQKMGLEPAKEHTKKLIQIAHETLESEPTIENSNIVSYWNSVFEQLNKIEDEAQSKK